MSTLPPLGGTIAAESPAGVIRRKRKVIHIGYRGNRLGYGLAAAGASSAFLFMTGYLWVLAGAVVVGGWVAALLATELDG